MHWCMNQAVRLYRFGESGKNLAFSIRYRTVRGPNNPGRTPTRCPERVSLKNF